MMMKNDESCMVQEFSIIAKDNSTISNKNTNHYFSKEYIREHMVMSNTDLENGLSISHNSRRTNSDLCSVNYTRNRMISG